MHKKGIELKDLQRRFFDFPNIIQETLQETLALAKQDKIERKGIELRELQRRFIYFPNIDSNKFLYQLNRC